MKITRRNMRRQASILCQTPAPNTTLFSQIKDTIKIKYRLEGLGALSGQTEQQYWSDPKKTVIVRCGHNRRLAANRTIIVEVYSFILLIIIKQWGLANQVNKGLGLRDETREGAVVVGDPGVRGKWILDKHVHELHREVEARETVKLCLSRSATNHGLRKEEE